MIFTGRTTPRPDTESEAAARGVELAEQHIAEAKAAAGITGSESQ